MSNTVFLLINKTFGSPIGVYTDETVAARIALANSCTIHQIEVNGLYPGYLNAVYELTSNKTGDEIAAATTSSTSVVTLIKA